MKHEKSCGVIIFHLQGSKPYFLLLKYGTKAKHWGFVKGNVESGESEEETAIREAREETGLSNLYMLPKFKEINSYFYKANSETIRKEVIYFLAESKTQEVKISHEHEDFKWLEFENAIKAINFKNDKEILTKAKDFIKENIKQKKLF